MERSEAFPLYMTMNTANGKRKITPYQFIQGMATGPENQ